MNSTKGINIAFALILIIFLFGCSREILLEDQIVKILENSENRDYESVIDYDIKGNYIVVVYKSKENDI
ncbi:hypothetical protein [Lederbergia citrea]|uniref:hypothetical protein n=1 Tax=Lederbergia citrea TaxID=2833581 RepID=UPI001BC9279A|nr:hypothetical protein [Lederbergia citrea]MBS4176884.1 hypothetical protein [Lederbergia citrea]